MKKNYQRKLNKIGIILRKIVWYLECREAFKISNTYDTTYKNFYVKVIKIDLTYYVKLRIIGGTLTYYFYLTGSNISESEIGPRTKAKDLENLYRLLGDEKKKVQVNSDH